MTRSAIPGRPRSAARPAAAALLAVALAGCQGAADDLQAWLAQQREQIRPSVAPLEPPKRYAPVPYAGAALTDAFSSQKLGGTVRQDGSMAVGSASASASASVYAREFNRRREPLEAVPLDAMAMVGSLARGATRQALVRVDKLLYQVRPGDYLGPNLGRVTAITETEIRLREIVQDAGGEWVERPAVLQLQEKAGS